MPKSFAGTVQFAAEQAGMDRAAHPELLDDAGADAADLVSSNRISGDTTQPRDFHLDPIGFIERQRYLRVGEGSSWRAAPVVAPLAYGQSVQHRKRLWHRLG